MATAGCDEQKHAVWRRELGRRKQAVTYRCPGRFFLVPLLQSMFELEVFAVSDQPASGGYDGCIIRIALDNACDVFAKPGSALVPFLRQHDILSMFYGDQLSPAFLGPQSPTVRKRGESLRAFIC